MVDRAEGLPFEIELQALDRRIAAYPARRNDGVEDAGELEELLTFTRGVAGRILAATS